MRDDEDYEYYWGSIRVPRWLGLILEVPWRQQMDLLLIARVGVPALAGLTHP